MFKKPSSAAVPNTDALSGHHYFRLKKMLLNFKIKMGSDLYIFIATIIIEELMSHLQITYKNIQTNVNNRDSIP